MLCVIINTTDGEVVDLQAPASAEVCDAVWAALVRTLGLGITTGDAQGGMEDKYQ